MEARLDHIVIWVDDPIRSVEFYQRILGLDGVRVADFRAGRAPFPSVRVSADSIIDLTARAGAASVDEMVGSVGSAGHPINHVCLAMSRIDFEALQRRLDENGISASGAMEQSFGARGAAVRSFYFSDPDGNVIEARYYAESDFT
jgi:catechol 2,3-dioxygenase-like lactoylglutathione lyase family enzyme